jgi:SAM-dependent methyltransferase
MGFAASRRTTYWQDGQRRGAQPMPKPPHSVVETARIVGRDWVDAPYHQEAEAAMVGQWHGIVLPFLRIEPTGIDLSVTLDLAAGHGRNAALLLPLVGHLHIVDINRPNLEACWRRFGEDPRISYHQTDGASLPVPDASVTFVDCFDAMVHFDSDVVRAYLRDCRRAGMPSCTIRTTAASPPATCTTTRIGGTTCRCT